MPRGSGSRHSKNAGTMGSESFTYEEKRALGYGTIKERLGKETVKSYDDCALCLHPAQDPVCTPEGVLYEKEAILECLVQQKKDIAKKLAIYGAQEQDTLDDAERARILSEEQKLADFHRTNHGAGKWETASAATRAEGASGGATAVQATEFAKKQLGEMKAFWMPSKTPDARVRAERPDTETKCPQTGKRLRLKDLIPVKFTPVPAAEARHGARFMCPLCKETFTNVSKIVVLKPTGDALTEECYKRLVEPDGTFNGVKVRPKDVIRLERGGTGFAATQRVESSRFDHLGIGNGLADSRGQHRGPTSKFGLRFN